MRNEWVRAESVHRVTQIFIKTTGLQDGNSPVEEGRLTDPLTGGVGQRR